MSRWVVIERIVVAVAIGLALVGCAGPGATPTATTVASAAPSIATATAIAMATATAATSLSEPPGAALSADGGDPVTGSLGSFTWADGGSDSPWLPGAPIAVGSGEPLKVTLAAPLAVNDWMAKRVPAGTTDGVGAVAIDEGGPAPISFPAPDSGSWSVQVTITFGDDLGSATYYWAVAAR